MTMLSSVLLLRTLQYVRLCKIAYGHIAHMYIHMYICTVGVCKSMYVYVHTYVRTHVPDCVLRMNVCACSIISMCACTYICGNNGASLIVE